MITVHPVNGIPVEENNNITLQCNVPGKTTQEADSLQFNWTKTGSPTKVLSSQNTLQLVNVMENDAGIYSCNVMDMKTLLSQNATIQVVVHCED